MANSSNSLRSSWRRLKPNSRNNQAFSGTCCSDGKQQIQKNGLIGSLFNGIPPSARSGRLILSLWTTKCCAIATPPKQRYGKLGGRDSRPCAA
jgi:hypothetical protein